MRITLRRSGLCHELLIGEYALRITAHTAARILQRTLGHDDVRAIGPMVLHHLAQASHVIEGGTLHRGDQVRTASPEGALLWEARNVDGKLILRGQMWVAAGAAHDERLRADCSTWATTVHRSQRAIRAR
jgi:hypothetical protein